MTLQNNSQVWNYYKIPLFVQNWSVWISNLWWRHNILLGHQWIPLTKVHRCGILVSPFIVSCWTNGPAAIDLRHHGSHVTSLWCIDFEIALTILQILWRKCDYKGKTSTNFVKSWTNDSGPAGGGGGGGFKNTYEILNLRPLKFYIYVNEIHIVQCMGKMFCVEFQRYPLKFHTKYLTHTLKDMIFIQHWNFKSS